MSFLDTQLPNFTSFEKSINAVQANLESKKQKLIAENNTARENALKVAESKADAIKTAIKGALENHQLVLDEFELPDKLAQQIQNEYKQVCEAEELRIVLETGEKLMTLASETLATAEINIRDASNMYRLEMVPLTQVLVTRLSLPNGPSSKLAQDTLIYIETRVEEVLRRKTLEQLDQVLSAENWPKNEPKSQEFSEAFKCSLVLETAESPVLETFVVLAKQLDIRVKYNFESDKDTARADKPEWLLGYVFKALDPHLAWLKSHVQPLLDDRFGMNQRFAIIELVSAFLPSIFRALKAYFSSVIHEPELVSHIVLETQKFDALLNTNYFYLPANSPEHWPGLTGALLQSDDWFNVWYQCESVSAIESLQQIMASETAWNIDFDAVEKGVTKPTVSALNLRNLLVSITEKYRGLASPKEKLEMLEGIQLTLLSSYYSKIDESLSLYAVMHSSLAKAMNTVQSSVSADRSSPKLSGMDAFQHLGQFYVSLSFMRDHMDLQNQDSLFYELAESLGRRVSDQGSGFFDEHLQAVDSIQKRLVKLLKSTMKDYARQQLQVYSRTQWRSWSEVLEITPVLVSPLEKLKKVMDHFKRLCSDLDFIVLKSEFTSVLETYFWANIIQANTFSQDAGKQLKKDILQFWETCGLVETPHYKRLLLSADTLAGSDVSGLSHTDKAEIQQRRHLD